MRARNPDHKSRYEIFSKAIADLERAQARLKGIDLRTCPKDLRESHRAARVHVAEAIQAAQAVCKGELDILDGRS